MHQIAIDKDLWEEDVEGVVTTWLFDEGDSIDQGDVVAEVMVEKIQYDITANSSGILKIIAQVGDSLKPGDIIAELV